MRLLAPVSWCVLHAVTAPYPNSATRSHPDYWCQQAERVASKFSSLTGESSFHFVDTLYHRYIISPNNNAFCDTITILTCLQKWIRKYHDSILQEKGVGDELACCEEIEVGISNVLKALEDILCHGMAGLEDIVKSHSCKELLYQMLLSI